MRTNLQRASLTYAEKYLPPLTPLLLLPCRRPNLVPVQQSSQILSNPPASSRKRKPEDQGQGFGYLSPLIRDDPPSKRPRTSPSSSTAEVGLKTTTTKTTTTEKNKDKKGAIDIIVENVDPLEYWTLTKRWPKEYFEHDILPGKEAKGDTRLNQHMENSTQIVRYMETNGLRLPCPLRKGPTSLRRKHSDSSLNSSGDQKTRDNKSSPYRDVRYITLLEGKGSYMSKSKEGPTEASQNMCKTLLGSEQTVPEGSLFGGDLFGATCDKVQDRNEARVIRSITPHIVPSAEDLETYGATHLEHLIEGVNEGWTASIPVEGPRPQPDYSVGFRRSAFTKDQLKKLDPLIGSVYDTSFFLATYRMYFPFLTSEVKCGAAALDVADRQNAHSMTIAVRGIVELYRAVKRENELNREILAFSISHDHSSVRIWGHYPVIERDKSIFYRHPIHKFDFTALEGKERWTAYKFIKNVYDKWMPIQFKKICSAVDNLPSDISFDLSQTASFSQFEPRSSQVSNESMLGRDDNQSRASEDVTPTTSFTQPAAKKSKK